MTEEESFCRYNLDRSQKSVFDAPKDYIKFKRRVCGTGAFGTVPGTVVHFTNAQSDNFAIKQIKEDVLKLHLLREVTLLFCLVLVYTPPRSR